MRALPFYSSPRADRSFNVGLSLVILFAAAEVFTLGFYYIGRMSPTRGGGVTAAAPIAAPSAPPVKLAVASPAPLPPVAPAISPAISPSSVALSAADRLVKEATASRERGDTASALARLQEASEKDPRNGQILAEMATIYESIKNFDRSTQTWRRIADLGPSAGTAYELASTKLKGGVASSTAPSGTALTSSAPITSDNSPQTDGLPAGSALGIAEVTATETPDADADTNLMLRIGVKKRANAVIDHTKVKIQVYFYDTLADNSIKLTDADVSYEWITPNHDWTDTNTEVLAVTYVRPKNRALTSEAALAAAAAAVNPTKKGHPAKPSPPLESGQRKYLGYIVRIYYNDQLQDKRAEPSKLLNLFPPPFTAPSQ